MQSFLKQPNSFSQNAKISAKSFLSSGKKLGSNLMKSSPVKVAKKLAPPTKQLAKGGFDVTKNMLMGIFDSIKSLRAELNQVKIKQVSDEEGGATAVQKAAGNALKVGGVIAKNVFKLGAKTTKSVVKGASTLMGTLIAQRAAAAKGNTGAVGAKGELGKLARKDPLLKKRLIQERMRPMGGKPSKDKSTLMGVTVDIAKKLLPTSKDTAKQRRGNDSSQFVKNYLDFFGSKRTARILRENLKITRNSLVDMFETTSLLKMQANNIANNLKTKDNKKGGGGLLGGLLGGLGKLSGFMKFLPALLPLIPLAIPFLKILAVGGMIALLIKFKDPIFKFIADSAGKIVGFLKDGILNIAKGIFNFFGKKPKEGAEGRTRRRSRRSDDEDTSVENERITEFDKRVNELQNKKKYGGTGRPITLNDKTYNPGDEGYKEAIATVSKAMKSNKQPDEVKEVSESKVEGAKEGTSGNVKADTGKNMDIVKNIEKQAIEESQDPQFEVVPFSISGSNNQPQTTGGSSSPSSSGGGGGSPSVSFFPSKNFDTISDQTAKSLMNIVDG